MDLQDMTLYERALNDAKVLRCALHAMGEQFDRFVGECMKEGKPITPTMQALSRARGYLPPGSKHGYPAKN